MLIREKLLNKIRLIIELTNNDVIFIGSISSYLNGVEYGWPIGDIDISISKESLKKLEPLGEIRYFTNNMFELDRASIIVDGILIDIFIGEITGKSVITEYEGLKIRHDRLEDIIEHLRLTISRFNERENKLFFLKFQHKLHKCIDTYNYKRELN